MVLTFRRITSAVTALLFFATVTLSAEMPVGMVSVAQNSLLDGANAVMGTNVYAGDAMKTLSNGTLRLRLGTSQFYMLQSTEATLAQDSGRLNARLARGTAGFSAIGSDKIEIETPLGVLRPADAGRAFGQISITAPNQAVVSSYEGNMILSLDGEDYPIAAGKSFRVTMADDAGGGGGSPIDDPQYGVGTRDQKRPKSHRHLIFDLIILGGAAGIGYWIWQETTESPSAPKKTGP